MKKIHFSLQRFCAIVIGVVFFFSGTVKMLDPIGTGLIVNEYLRFLHLGFLRFMSMPGGMMLSVLEALTGAALIANAYRRVSAYVSLILTGIFLIVSIILWIFNPVMDCGCFGEAIHLTHIQTLIKNLILSVLACVAFFPLPDRQNSKKKDLYAFWAVSATAVCLMFYSLVYIPPTDFTEFNLASKLAASVNEGDSFSPDRFVTVFVYEKNGQEGSFTLNRLPDSTWTYVRTDVLEKDDGIEVSNYPVLSFRDAGGEYCDSLAAEGGVMLVSVYKPGSMRVKAWERVGSVLASADTAGFTPILLMAAPQASVGSIIPDKGLSASARTNIIRHAYYADYKVLLSLNRSNGGGTFIYDGNLIEKWANRALPDEERLNKIYNNNSVDTMIMASTKGRLTYQAFYLYSFVLLFFL